MVASTIGGASKAQTKVWHVSGNGKDSNSGISAKNAFRSLQKAAELTMPGDTVIIDNGIYNDANFTNGSSVVNIYLSGKPGAYITWKAKAGSHPLINPSKWGGITVTASYIELKGLTVLGMNDSITLLDGITDSKNKVPDPRYNTNGIIIEGRKNRADSKPHHVTVSKCIVGKCPGGGIVGLEADYLTIEDCDVYENAWYMRYAGSGITTLNNWAFDEKPGYHIIIQRNRVWNNKTLVPWERTGKLSDGNGILLDVTDQEQGSTNPNGDAVLNTSADSLNKQTVLPKNKRPEWKGRALIAYNLSAFNGGSGIHTFRTSHVDIINNTTYWNGQIVGYQELFPNQCEDIVILNNIIIPRPGGKVTSNYKNRLIKWDYNMYANSQQVLVGEHDIVADALLIRPKIAVTEGNFRPGAKSLAIGSGTTILRFERDLEGRYLSRDKSISRGAYNN
ncbi:MAG: right-handed parallel beta-helix repeat-containing protein [Pedobacter sp.]|nr:right-handed parallel beta-helix repeat-containing protein [Pedobacter sp.]